MQRKMNRIFKMLLSAILVLSLLTVSTILAEETISSSVIRLAGKDRLMTSYLVADQLMEQKEIEMFDSVIVASGSTFADALPGSYLSAVKDAPILLAMPNYLSCEQTRNYIKTVLRPGGTVYILGGTSAVLGVMESNFEGYIVKRVSGNNRFLTNLEILKEAGVNDYTEILVCTSSDYADSLSASATGKPILLVSKKLTSEQKEFLETLTGVTFTVVGGEKAVSNSVIHELNAYGNVTRLAGKDRLDTSVMVAKKYFEDVKEAIVTYGWNFPDGLCGGSLAYAMQAPLLLTRSSKSAYEFTANYTNDTNITSGYVLGGSGLVSDLAVNTIFSTKNIQMTQKMQGRVVLDASNITITPLIDAKVHVVMNASKGILQVASLDEKIAKATVEGNTITVVPQGNLGSATVTVTSSATDAFEKGMQTFTVTVEDSDLQLTAKGFEGDYDGVAHGIEVTCEGAKITYATTIDGEYTANCPTFIDVGTYTVFYKVEKDGYTTISNSEEVIIKKVQDEVTVVEEVTLECGTMEEVVVSMESDGEITVESSDTNVVTARSHSSNLVISAMNEGKATITITIAETTNYLSTTITLRVNVVMPENILKVGSDKEFTTIQAAVDAANDGDTIIVYPGIYKEAVDVTTKTITIVGTDKEVCILTYPNGDYYNPPLEMASGVLKNIQIIATAQTKLPDVVAKAYCLHIDYDMLENKTFYVENVDFINNDYQVVGIGLRANSTLEFVNCTFISKNSMNAMYCHDHVKQAKNQKLVVRNCEFTNSGPSPTIQMQTQEQEGSSVNVTWEYNTVTNKSNPMKLVEMYFYNASIGNGNWLNTSYWTLTEDSCGNNVSKLNYKKGDM